MEMHEELNGGEQQPPEYRSAWSASRNGADDQVSPEPGDAGQAWQADADAPTQPSAEDTGPLTPHVDPLTPGADPLTPRADEPSAEAAEPGSPDAAGTGPLVPGLGAPPDSSPGYEYPATISPGPLPPPPPGYYVPPGGYGPGYPGAGYSGYPGAGYPGGGYPGAGYPGGGYPGAGYPGGGYPGGGYEAGGYGAYQGDSGYGQGRPPKRVSRVVTYVLVAALAAGVGAGTVLAMRHNDNNATSFTLPGSGSIPRPGSGSSGGGSSKLTTQSVVNKVGPGIVDVISTPSYQPGGTLEGTGMVLTKSGLVLTNNHVVEGTTHEIAKIANTGQQYKVTVLGTDSTDDVALLKLDGASNLKTVPLGNSDNAQVGQSVVALGNAEGQDGRPTVVTGTITDLNRSIQASDAGAGTTENLHGMLQTNAPIVEGDSGGALANTQGLVIGMNTAAYTQSAGAGGGSSMGFAIPINRALSIARQIKGGHATAQIQLGYPAFLGVTVARSKDGPSTSSSPQTQLRQLQQPLQSGQGGFGGFGGGAGSNGGCLSTDQPSAPQNAPNISSGVLVGGVLCGTPVSSVGVTAGAVITGIDSHAITSPAELTNILSAYRPGQSVTLTWVSANGQHRTSKLTLIAGPAK
jgi:S1-C subfamily serine protease